MTTLKRFFQFSIATTTVLVASLSCFAQTDTPASPAESESVVAVVVSREIRPTEAVSNTPSVNSGEVVDKNQTTSSFSSAKFMMAAKEAVNTNSQIRFDSIEAPKTSEFDAPAKSRKITFVPSRGQRLPDKQ
jgi:hypothetical protein